jgi:PPOX class probable F420-dependent enzyme
MGSGDADVHSRRGMAMSELSDARYISLTTYKRNGEGVATPVWIAGSNDNYRFTTGDQAWKTRRLTNNPNVTVQVSNVRGRVAPGATTYTGTGAVRSDPEAVAAAERAIAQKYGWQFKATKVVDRVKITLRIGTKQEVVAIELILHPSG